MGGAESERRQRPGVVGRLLRTVRADPSHMPERLAAFVVAADRRIERRTVNSRSPKES